ncbi:hypothetical protein EVJ58_g5848 [Rhodofomes roseus]|uniref:Uncharacterized protein n=1 Tax=Rhodofomes roseus TaxID=34475 RepID=A0A4Y9YAJ0_9APHY|nr:hypothetical protein EVJ58_g5848 [Rhodofomes roseus]
MDAPLASPGMADHASAATVPSDASADEDPVHVDDNPVPFEGDYFGGADDYGADDLPFDEEPMDVDPNSRDAAEESSDDERSEDDAVGRDIVQPLPDVERDGRRLQSPPLNPVPHNPAAPEFAADDDDAVIGNGEQAPAPGGIGLAQHEQVREAPVSIVPFGGQAGAPLQPDQAPHSGYDSYAEKVDPDAKNPYAPFASRMDWEIARWAKLRGSGSTAFTDLLAIAEVRELLGLSFKNSDELNKIIDERLPNRRPAFHCFEACVGGERFEMFCRDILECILALYGDPEHASILCITPERHYADADKTLRLYHDLHTGKWWWATQRKLEEDKPGATIIPVIISSDKTQLTQFRNKTAYPVYLTIGNLPKEIRRKPSHRGQILLAYLPTSRLEHITNKAARCRTLANVFHVCLSMIVEPLRQAGIEGVPMTSGDGVERRCHPILAVYVGDYPEQVLVTGTYTGDCPICECSHDDLGSYPNTSRRRDINATFDALAKFGTADYNGACDAAGIKPVQHPFWENLPYVDIYRTITPDLLHQLYQGVVKHVLSWITSIVGEDEVDARVRRLPPNHSIRIFHKGITGLSRVTGTEHKQMARFILALLIDVRLPGGEPANDLIAATTALLDFVYMAQYSVHSDATLDALEESLATFHAKKDIFARLGVHENFTIPKLHMMAHYVDAIKSYGTTDNYNTESTERLHIDFAKEAYCATNHKDEFPQMTKWLERREKVLQHADYVEWRLLRAQDEHQDTIAGRPAVIRWRLPDMSCALHHVMAKWPSRKAVPIATVMSTQGYGATFFTAALSRYIIELKTPGLTRNEVEARALQVRLPFSTVPVFHKIKFRNVENHGKETLDSIHARPQEAGQSGDVLIPARFDTALIQVRLGPNGGLAAEPHNALSGMPLIVVTFYI